VAKTTSPTKKPDPIYNIRKPRIEGLENLDPKRLNKNNSVKFWFTALCLENQLRITCDHSSSGGTSARGMAVGKQMLGSWDVHHLWYE